MVIKGKQEGRLWRNHAKMQLRLAKYSDDRLLDLPLVHPNVISLISNFHFKYFFKEFLNPIDVLLV
jgi:hypothetical protein